MKKLLMALTCLGVSSVFANCDVYIDSYINFNQLESGSLIHYKFDELYNNYHATKIPLNEISKSYYVMGSSGDNFDCNTKDYHGNPAFTVKVTPYCKNQINSTTIANIKKGNNLTINCESNISINIYKEYNNLLNLSILPTEFDDLTIRSVVAPKNESQGIAFIIKNLNSVSSPMSCNQAGKYYNCQAYGELKLLFSKKLSTAKIDVFSFDHQKYAKIGECNITRVNNQPLVSCSTLPQYNEFYKVIAKNNSFIAIINPNEEQ